MKIIHLSNDTQLHLYLVKTEFESFDDTFSEIGSHSDDISPPENDDSSYETSARKIIEAMEDNYSVALLDAILLECARTITSHWSECAPQRLEEPRYKCIKRICEKLETDVATKTKRS